MVDLLAGPIRARPTGEADGARHVRAGGGEDGGGRPSAVRLLRDRRGPGRRGRGAALSGGPGREPAERLVLRRGSRTAHLPDAVLLAGARRRRARAIPYAADQLPHVASDPATGRPTAAARAGRRRRQRGAARGDGLGVQRTSAPGEDVRFAGRRDGDAIADWLRARQGEGYAPHAIGVFVRSPEQIERALSAVRAAGMRAVQLDDGSGGASGSVAVGTMHLAKGLEFRAVAVAACDDEVIPLQARIERVGDDADLEEVYGTERHLLYVACTRARDRLLVTGVDPGSEFLDDLRAEE